MARGLRRLGALLTLPGGDEGDALLVEAVELLASVPSPRGAEGPLAQAVVAFARERWPDARWRVQAVDGADCAQVVGEVGPADASGLLLCSHLDTSLTGEAAFDLPVTGLPPTASGLDVDPAARTLTGFGLGVAKAPAAAALVAFGRASRAMADEGRAARLLLSARGTHRSPYTGVIGDPAEPVAPTGVEVFLDEAVPPRAAIVAKGGPAGVLHDEPGAAYVRVTFRSGWGAVMARDAVRPPGGVLAHLGALVSAVAEVGDGLARILAERPNAGQAGACFGLGAVRSGQPAKADLVPGIVEVFGYLVAPGELDIDRVSRVFDAALREVLADLPGIEPAVDVRLIHDGGSTAAGSAVARAAVDAWQAEHLAHGVLDPPQPVVGWTGSTDGVVLRGRGIETVRLGPSRTRSGPSGDVVDADELAAFARIYEQLLRTPLA